MLNLKEQIFNILKKLFNYEDKLNITIIEENDTINIQPNDIYTALILDDIKIPYELVKDAQFYETEQKQYRIVDGKVVIKELSLRGQPMYACMLDYD